MMIVKFMKNNCFPCTMVTNLLNDKNIHYVEVNALEDTKENLEKEYGKFGTVIDEIKQGLNSVPQLVLFDNDFNVIDSVNGYNVDAIDELLNKLKDN